MTKHEIFDIKPIKFLNIGDIGDVGTDGIITNFRLSKLITQNILYSAYHKPRSINEIADLLGLKPSSIKDEIDFLEDNGFMDKVSDDSYLTNMLIHDFPRDVYEEKHKIYSKYANLLCEKYIPLLLDSCKDLINNSFNTDSIFSQTKKNTTSIYSPNNDINFLLWSLITLACARKFIIPDKKNVIEKYFVKRNDGGENIIYTTLEKDYTLSFNADKYKTSIEALLSFIPKHYYPFSIWQYDTFYDDRIIHSDYVSEYSYTYLYHFISGKICSDMISLRNEKHEDKDISDKINAMKEKGFIANDGSNYVNLIVSCISLENILNKFPDNPEFFLSLNNQLSTEIYNLCKNHYPPHIKDLAEAFFINSLSSGEIVTRILDNLLINGILKPLKECQKKTVNIIMFYESID